MESEPLYSVATLLDLIYKDRYAESLLTLFNMMILCVCNFYFCTSNDHIILHKYFISSINIQKGYRLILNVTYVYFFDTGTSQMQMHQDMQRMH